MILYDCEADGLLKASAIPLEQQPRILEIGLLIVDDSKKKMPVMAEWNTFVNPGRPVPDEVVKITGITDAMVKGAPTFAALYGSLVQLFLGQKAIVAHNLPYDRGVLAGELQRIGKLTQFPWPPNHICTCETTEHLEGKYLKQEVLYERVTGRPAQQTHRALDDVKQLYEIVRWCRTEKLL
jgi:DNA polymerase-3 subunit epsilon